MRLKFWSNNLKEFVMVKKRQMVTDGITEGIIIRVRVTKEFAPSTLAASKISVEILLIPAI